MDSINILAYLALMHTIQGLASLVIMNNNQELQINLSM